MDLKAFVTLHEKASNLACNNQQLSAIEMPIGIKDLLETSDILQGNKCERLSYLEKQLCMQSLRSKLLHSDGWSSRILWEVIRGERQTTSMSTNPPELVCF